MSQDMTAQPMTWLVLLVFVAAALLGRSLPVEHGNSDDLLVNTLQALYADARERGYRPDATNDRRTVTGTPAGSLWTRLQDGLALPAGKPDAVQAQLERFMATPGNVERILQRGRPYLHHILNEIQHRGLPTELALLPAIESAFDPFARSPKGATGLWQFMPATGSELGLQQGKWYDGRRDVIAATDAALDYLTRLHRSFDGDWLLALAAYNAGAGRVHKAMRHNRDAGKAVDFWHLPLPKETRDYVPKLLALRTLIQAPEVHGLNLPAIPDTPEFTVVDAGGPLDLGVAARIAGISLEEMHRLNPGYSRQTIHRNGPRTLLVPKAQAAAFRTQLAILTETQRVPWVRHRIRFGDTLSTIAQRYRIPLARLREFNLLPDANIMAGDLLIVPVIRG
jgi:membrane-bound lytic murein transglycosylase D